MATFKLESISDIHLKDPITGKFTGKILKRGHSLCITLPNGKYTERNLFTSVRMESEVTEIMEAVNSALGEQLTPDQFSSGYWKFVSNES
ncbi:MAG: hypothetical protein HDS69_09665 [Bacteroidales bacterium]|nr:hypothetical protein [Bacteroidales bacterium]